MRRVVRSILAIASVSLLAGSATLATPAPDSTASTPDKIEAPEGTADEKPVLKKEYVIQIKNHRFVPAELVVPAGKKIKLRIENLDKSPEEFESYELNREKIVGGGKKITVFIGPLKAGKYAYFGEFNPDTAQGVIIAK